MTPATIKRGAETIAASASEYYDHWQADQGAAAESVARQMVADAEVLARQCRELLADTVADRLGMRR